MAKLVNDCVVVTPKKPASDEYTALRKAAHEQSPVSTRKLPK